MFRGREKYDELYREVDALGPDWESRSIYEFVEEENKSEVEQDGL